MKIRLIFFLCVAFLFTTQSWGQTELAPYLYLEKTDGSISEIPFANSEVKILGDSITVNMPAESIQFNFSEINSLSFKLKSDTQLKLIASSGIKIFLDNTGDLHISGNQPLGDISIYGITGQLLKKVVTNNTETTIDISGFAKGIYLVKTYEKTVKIIK